ncbi:Transketolase, partial [Nowakowskiella sp. JEL0078]
KTSEIVLNAIADKLPELIGGSADLTGSNYTRWKTAVDFQPPNTGLGSYNGRYIRFGVREHGMAAVCNGIAAYGANFIPFGATFLNFISYALGSVRLSALSKHQVLYIMTHDSIGLGEDGPTHQPIETLAELRAIPNLHVFRPADGNETSGAYYSALTQRHTPTVMAYSRQNCNQLEGSSIEKTLKGAYVLSSPEEYSVILVATGSEVQIAQETQKYLKEHFEISARVVSFPCWELFEEQSQEYKESVFEKGKPVVSIEVMTTLGWHKYAHYPIGIDTFGKSAPAKDVYKYFGFYAEALASKVKKVVEHYATIAPEWKIKPIIA